MERFVKQANDFILNKSLMVDDCEYNFVEVEFYECSDEHFDTFTHCHPQQQTNNQWYFHRASKKVTSKYRGGTYKGVDITFSTNGGFCGMLVRAIESVRDEKIIEGPCRCVNELLKQTNCDSIDELVDSIDLDVFTKDALYVKDKDVALSNRVRCGPRIGLNARNDANKEKYVNRNYRFVRDGVKVKKWRTLE